jgi:hypothetical protein
VKKNNGADVIGSVTMDSILILSVRMFRMCTLVCVSALLHGKLLSAGRAFDYSTPWDKWSRLVIRV